MDDNYDDNNNDNDDNVDNDDNDDDKDGDYYGDYFDFGNGDTGEKTLMGKNWLHHVLKPENLKNYKDRKKEDFRLVLETDMNVGGCLKFGEND